MTVRCEECDGRMETNGELLDSGDGELREELECVECGETSAIYHTADGNETLEADAYDDRDLSVGLEGSDGPVEWSGSVSHNSWGSAYDREVRGRLEIDGPEGTLVVLKTWRAMAEEGNDLAEPGVVIERSTYYREGETERFDDSRAEWDVGEDVIDSPQEFVGVAKEGAEADPRVEYEQRASEL